jgi:hypothetical protein
MLLLAAIVCGSSLIFIQQTKKGLDDRKKKIVLNSSCGVSGTLRAGHPNLKQVNK